MPDRTFVIGDVHGCSQTLDGLINTFDKLTDNDRIIFLGDLLDRGPDSKSVLDKIIELKSGGIDVTIIRGNHEQMFLKAIDNPKSMKEWFRNGGKATLDSFEVYHPGFIDEKYIDLIANSEYFIKTDKYIIAHAGLNFSISNPLSDKEKMISMRIEFCDTSKIGNRKLIVGHTPFSLEKIKSSLSSDLIRLDGGCVYFRQVQSLGYLVALELNSHDLYHLQNIDFA